MIRCPAIKELSSLRNGYGMLKNASVITFIFSVTFSVTLNVENSHVIEDECMQMFFCFILFGGDNCLNKEHPMAQVYCFNAVCRGISILVLFAFYTNYDISLRRWYSKRLLQNTYSQSNANFNNASQSSQMLISTMLHKAVKLKKT